jgi:hypothetical protein
LFEAIGCQYPRNGENLLGVLEYYEAVLKRNGLVNREGEFRCLKLGLILDLLKIVDIPDDLRSELISAVISSWRMSPLAKTLPQTDEELRKMLHSIDIVRNEVQGAILNPSSNNAMQLDVPIMFVLPLMPSDINTEDVPRIHNLLSEVIKYFASKNDAYTADGDNLSGSGT